MYNNAKHTVREDRRRKVWLRSYLFILKLKNLFLENDIYAMNLFYFRFINE